MLSPDEGSIKRALSYQKKLGGAIAIVDKRRSSATEVKSMNLSGGMNLHYDKALSKPGVFAVQLMRPKGGTAGKS